MRRRLSILVLTLLVLPLSAHRRPVTSVPAHPPALPPKAVLYQGVIWKLELVPEIDPGLVGDCQGEHHRLNNDIWLGMTYYGEHRIEIRAGQKQRDEADSVLHELMHAVSGVEFDCKKETGHEAIYSLSPKLIELFHQNPPLVRYFEQATK